ncbi:uncharacterized protein TRAVEDRAFT_74748 [Trametes versicolor FP-101664 SS1]|uniref:uncharacterized protein n=1 Tax=Trametes versicolor (strain FP-101664) TaxID=717944 RepID=UPI000462317D|nr:uncharacterized protein TRAVEDRAFT_74748 [Trametes versicolor FP-101664 SS1]EIW53417.1 hypothetical protein TRAVEDRAFT_74748 [Trametes versicolor FP-101664 SS1]
MRCSHNVVLLCFIGAVRAAWIRDRTASEDTALDSERVWRDVAVVTHDPASVALQHALPCTGPQQYPQALYFDGGAPAENGQHRLPTFARSSELPAMTRASDSLAVAAPKFPSLPVIHTPLRRQLTQSTPDTSVSPTTDTGAVSQSLSTGPATTTEPTATPTSGDASISLTPSSSGDSHQPSAIASQTTPTDRLAPYKHSLIITVVILSVALFALVVVIAVLMFRKRKAKAKYIEVSALSAPVVVGATEDHRRYSYTSESIAESNPFIQKEERGRGLQSRRSSVSSVSRYSQ